MNMNSPTQRLKVFCGPIRLSPVGLDKRPTSDEELGAAIGRR
jgi:hypothetical protein